MATTVNGMTTYNGHTYYIVTSDELGTTAEERWENAKIHCANLGGHLAIIDDANENAALFSYIQSLGINNAYFGISDAASEGTWTWVDGTPLTYSNWGTGAANGDEPNGYTYENYGMFYGGSYPNGEWNDGDFVGSFTAHESTVSFICEVDSVIEQPIVTLPPDTPVTPETLPPAVSGAAYDIVFILDVSGSMGYYINRVNAIAQTFVDKLAERGITDYRIGVMEYETASVIYPLDVYGSLFTTDINAFTSAMAVASNGTRGGTENGLTALNDAVSNYALQARPEANKEFILLTDEDFDDGATVSVSGIEQLLNDNGIQLDVIGAVDGSCDSAWTPVARSTGGNFYDINGDYTETFNEIVLNLDCVNVDLSTVPDGQTGWFLLVPGNHVTDLKSVDAVFVSATDPNLEAYAQVLEVVGRVSADKVYNAASSRYRQNVTIPDMWNVTGTSHADILNVAGTGFGVVIASGDGHDAVKLGESATGIILTDHDLSNDGLEFAKRQPLGTFTESVATDPVTLMNQVALTSPTMTAYLQNFSSPLQEEFDAKNAQFMAYGVTNGNRSDTVYDLLFSEDYVGDGNGRIMFAQWGYGFTPPEGNPLFVEPTLATSADLAADFGSPTLDEISPANFAVTANETPDQNLTAFNPKVAEMILATSKSKF